ncbi:hypothetical protein [Nocardia callitridis]|uniref:PE domain-containing protein n=1 Tax=Nocardia callitridis TaxID=648753 RepID=A0ABP9JR59_9NOCA
MAEPAQGDIQPILDRWKSLKTRAEGGDLRLDTETGQQLAGHAERMYSALEELVPQAQRLEHLSGFGSLSSAESLRGKFASKAGNSDDSAKKRISQSLEVVKLMKETYELAIRKLTDTDQSTAGQFAGLGNGD